MISFTPPISLELKSPESTISDLGVGEKKKSPASDGN
jgi:hypothetical protein